MIGPKKKTGAAHPERSTARSPRPLHTGGARPLGYPSIKSLVSAAAIAAAGLASGCSPPECSSTRIGEVTTHGEAGVRQILDLDVKGGFESFAIGAGITPHPAIPLAGAVMPVVPYAPPPASDGEADAGSAPAPEE